MFELVQGVVKTEPDTEKVMLLTVVCDALDGLLTVLTVVCDALDGTRHGKGRGAPRAALRRRACGVP